MCSLLHTLPKIFPLSYYLMNAIEFKKSSVISHALPQHILRQNAHIRPGKSRMSPLATLSLTYAANYQSNVQEIETYFFIMFSF